MSPKAGGSSVRWEIAVLWGMTHLVSSSGLTMSTYVGVTVKLLSLHFLIYV